MGEEFLKSIRKEEAERILMNEFECRKKIEEVHISECANRVLAEDVYAKEPLPPFFRSTMDGYAIKASSTFPLSESSPIYLKLIGEVKMGEVPSFCIDEESCCKIATGAALPSGADAVVMVEDTEELDDGNIWVKKRVAPFSNVLRCGEDVKEGALLLQKCERLSFADVALLSSAGKERVKIYEKLRISIISTGDEIIEPGMQRVDAKIYDSNSFMLLSLFQENGFFAKREGIVEDDARKLKEKIASALDGADVVVVIGASSVGERDYVKEALESVEAKILFHGLCTKPGRPTLFAKKDEKMIAALPGNPTSCAVITLVLLLPHLLRIQGQGEWMPKRLNAILKESISSQKGRREYVRGRLHQVDEVLYVEPIFGASALIFPLKGMDALIEIPEEWEGAEAGERVQVIKV